MPFLHYFRTNQQPPPPVPPISSEEPGGDVSDSCDDDANKRPLPISDETGSDGHDSCDDNFDADDAHKQLPPISEEAAGDGSDAGGDSCAEDNANEQLHGVARFTFLCRKYCPTFGRYLQIFMQYGLLGFVLLILLIWLGSEYENYHVRKAASTVSYYEQSTVCGLMSAYPPSLSNNTSRSDGTTSTRLNNKKKRHNDTPISDITNASLLQAHTFSSVQQALNETDNNDNNQNPDDNLVIAHCGACGQCSNPHDVQIYDDTKNTLFGTTVTCAKRGFIWGRRTASNCMEDKVGFTTECNSCWVDNIICDLRKCVFTCIWQSMFNEVDTGQDGQSLNRCTVCDELRCGPEFIKCAGVNRRRAGIISDIDRDVKTEVCKDVNPPAWWNDPVLQQEWQAQQDFIATMTTSTPSQQSPTRQPSIRRL